MKHERSRVGRMSTAIAILRGSSAGCQLLYQPSAAFDAKATQDGNIIRIDSGTEPLADAQADAPMNCVGDADCDLVKDNEDLCPTDYGPANRDEDDDKIGDVCDNCVGISNNDRKDDDNDGVGDACDPVPGQPDRVVAKYFVERGAPIANITALPNRVRWDINADSATSQVTFENLALEIPTEIAADARLSVEIGVTATSPPPQFLGLRIGDSTGYFECALSVPSAVDAPVLQLRASNGIVTQAPMNASDKGYQIRIDRFNATQRCALIGQNLFSIDAALISSEKVTLFVEKTIATINYVVIYAAAP
jgi:hypothetical protein